MQEQQESFKKEISGVENKVSSLQEEVADMKSMIRNEFENMQR